MKGMKTGGRVKGSKNKRTRELEKLAEKALLAGMTPLDYLLGVMRNPRKPTELRVDAAKAVAPYLHARRAPEDKQGRTVPPTIWHRPDLQGPKKK